MNMNTDSISDSGIQSVPRHLIALTCLALAGMVSAGSLLAANSGAANAVPAGAAGAPAPFGHAASAPTKKRLPAAPVKLVDINSANRAQLKALPGIGDAEAERIIAGRPYLSKAELVTKNVLPTGPYLSLKDRVVAMPRIKPKGKS